MWLTDCSEQQGLLWLFLQELLLIDVVVVVTYVHVRLLGKNGGESLDRESLGLLRLLRNGVGARYGQSYHGHVLVGCVLLLRLLHARQILLGLLLRRCGRKDGLGLCGTFCLLRLLLSLLLLLKIGDACLLLLLSSLMLLDCHSIVLQACEYKRMFEGECITINC